MEKLALEGIKKNNNIQCGLTVKQSQRKAALKSDVEKLICQAYLS